MKAFTIALPQIAAIPAAQGGRRYDSKLNDITSVLSGICDALADHGSTRFIVGGFGQDQWPVDVRTDLAVAVEQVPNALNAVRRGVSASLDFYEQGVQRLLTMEPTGAQVVLECQSGTSWQPNPGVVTMNRDDLVGLLSAFLRQFVEQAGQRCPELVHHVSFREWAAEA